MSHGPASPPSRLIKEKSNLPNEPVEPTPSPTKKQGYTGLVEVELDVSSSTLLEDPVVQKSVVLDKFKPSKKIARKQLEHLMVVVKPVHDAIMHQATGGRPKDETVLPVNHHESDARRCSLSYIVFLISSVMLCQYGKEIKFSLWKYFLVYILSTGFVVGNFFTTWLFAILGQDALAGAVSLLGMPAAMTCMYLFAFRPLFVDYTEDRHRPHPTLLITTFFYAVVTTPFMYMSVLGIRNRESSQQALELLPNATVISCTSRHTTITGDSLFVQFDKQSYRLDYSNLIGYWPPGDLDNPSRPDVWKPSTVFPGVQYCVHCYIPIVYTVGCSNTLHGSPIPAQTDQIDATSNITTPSSEVATLSPSLLPTKFVAQYYQCDVLVEQPADFGVYCQQIIQSMLQESETASIDNEQMFFERTKKHRHYNPFVTDDAYVIAEMSQNLTVGANVESVNVESCTEHCWEERRVGGNKRAQHWALALGIAWVLVEPLLLLLSKACEIHLLGGQRV